MPSRYCRRHLARYPTVWSFVIAGILILNTNTLVGQNSAKFEIHQLRYTTAVESRRILIELLGDLRSQVRILVDNEQQQLLLSGPPEAQTIARELIAKIDRPRPSTAKLPQRVLRTYPRSPSQLQSDATMLRRVFSGREIRVAIDTDGTQLVVVASSDVQQRIQQLFSRTLPAGSLRPINSGAGQSTSAKPRADADREQTIVLKYRPPKVIQDVLTRLLGQRLKPDRDGSLLFAGASGRKVRIQIDPQRRRFRIAGSQSLVQQFAVLVQQIDAAGNSNGRVIQFLPTTNVDSAALKQALKAYHSAQPQPPAEDIPPQGRLMRDPNLLPAAFFQDDNSPIKAGKNRPAPGDDKSPQDTPDSNPTAADDDDPPLNKPVTNVEIQTLDDLDVIILRGRGADVQELTRIIREIERLSAEAAPEIEVYHLSHVQGEAVRDVANQVLDALTENIQGRVSVTPLVKPNALLLIGWGEALKKVKELLGRLDTPVIPQSQMRVFHLQHAAAESIRNAVTQFFEDREGLGTKIRVTTDTRTNSLVIHAAPRDLNEVQLLIKQLDTSNTRSVNRARIVRLKNSLATDLATTLRATIEAARGAGDDNQRSAAVEMLMMTPEGSRVVKSGVLNDVRITPDVRTNTLILSGPSQSLPLLETLIQRLDEAPASTAQIKVFQIINADASALVIVLRTLFP
ncbi:MAG: secretin N-terminal domain-containing protein, partial [Planctomycetaceae bacterium]